MVKEEANFKSKEVFVLEGEAQSIRPKLEVISNR